MNDKEPIHLIDALTIIVIILILILVVINILR